MLLALVLLALLVLPWRWASLGGASTCSVPVLPLSLLSAVLCVLALCIFLFVALLSCRCSVSFACYSVCSGSVWFCLVPTLSLLLATLSLLCCFCCCSVAVLRRLGSFVAAQAVAFAATSRCLLSHPVARRFASLYIMWL